MNILMLSENPQNLTALETSLKKHLAQSQLPRFDTYLFNKILDKIEYQKRLSALKPKIWVAAGVLLGTLVLLVFALETSFKAFAGNPTAKYLSLIFTDFGQVVNNWQDYAFSVLESLPLGALAFLLSSFLAGLLLVDFSTKQLNTFRKLLSQQNYGPR